MCSVFFLSHSEGISGNNTGDLYFFVSTLDQTMVDISKHNFVSMSLTEYQNGVCEDKKLDAEDPWVRLGDPAQTL